MFFHVLGIKEIGGKNYKLDFVIEAGLEKDLRMILSNIGIVVLSIQQYKENPENFGPTKLIINIPKGENNFSIIIKSVDYRKSYLLTALIGVEVIEISSLDPEKPIDQEKLATQIIERKGQLEKLKQANHSNEKVRKENDFDIQDHKITEMQLLASQVIQRSKVILQGMADDMSTQERKKLNELTQELSKIRLGTNIEKMKFHANEIIIIINDVEKRQINKLTDFQQSIFQGSAVTNVDVAKEVQRYEKAEDIKNFGGEKTTTDQFYMFLGKMGFHLKFLSKDFLNKISKFDQVVTSVFLFFQTLFVLVLVPMGIYLVYADKMITPYHGNSSFILIKIAVLGALLYATKAFAKSKYLLILLGIVLSIPLYFLIIMVIRNTLSL